MDFLSRKKTVVLFVHTTRYRQDCVARREMEEWEWNTGISIREDGTTFWDVPVNSGNFTAGRTEKVSIIYLPTEISGICVWMENLRCLKWTFLKKEICHLWIDDKNDQKEIEKYS